jgi:hypothetical protein
MMGSVKLTGEGIKKGSTMVLKNREELVHALLNLTRNSQDGLKS